MKRREESLIWVAYSLSVNTPGVFNIFPALMAAGGIPSATAKVL